MTKARRRQYGSGGIHQRTSDNRWVGTIEAGYSPSGARRRVVVTAATEADCKRKLDARRGKIQREGLSTAGTSTRTNVKQWAEYWLETQVSSLRPKTWADYRSAIRRWIVPRIGHKRLDSLTPADIHAVAAAQRKEGRSSTTARRTHVVLRLLLKAAAVEGHSVPTRILSVKAPARAVSDREALTTPEAIAVLNVASTLTDGSRWVAALLQGMRQAECLGLTWDAVDLDVGTIDVSWQLQALPYLDRKAGTFRVPDGYEHRHLEKAWHLVRPKTERGQRIIPLVPWMAAALTAWQKVAPTSPHGLVWPRLDGRPCDVKTDTAEWAALQGSAGVGHPDGRHYHLHEARHTTVTLLLEAGIDPGVITAIVGHSSIVTSRGYQHVSQTMARQAMERVAEKLQLGQTRSVVSQTRTPAHG